MTEETFSLPFTANNIHEVDFMFHDSKIDETIKNLESLFVFNAMLSESF